MNVEYGAAALNMNLTSDLCTFLADLEFDDLPSNAVHEARRGVLDYMGCALAGSGHETISKLLSVLENVSGKQQSTVLGRNLRLGLLEAPIANGQMGHLLDYDDTHMGGVVLHTSSPVLAALFALADARPVDGRNFITSYVAGFEAGVRVGRSAPAHHDGGWHLTGTLGTIAAGVAASRLISLSPEQATYAAGIATTQASGMQQNRGTMCKSFHAGRAASNGVLAALLAEQGFDSSPEIVEGKRGFIRIFSTSTDTQAMLKDLGREWLITSNGHKPYACGVVLHPLIDAMIQLANEHDIDVSDIRKVDARVHPAMIRITGIVRTRPRFLSRPRPDSRSRFTLIMRPEPLITRCLTTLLSTSS
jgi:2-methylcitrate dehydratase PrpD